MDPSAGVVQTTTNGGPGPGAAPYNQMISPPNMAMVSVNNILNVKDSRWLQLEVCREFQRNKCTRPDTECKFAHPPPNVEVQNGRVTACYDSIKGRCNREKPPCKYFHPPQHLKDQLLINGRNHLALKNALMNQIHGIPATTSVMPAGTLPMVSRQPTPPGGGTVRWGVESHPQGVYQTASPYLQGIPTMGGFTPYLASSSPVMPMGVNDCMASQLQGCLPQQMLAAQKIPRTDRLENFPGVLPYKRTATEKSGMPMFQPGNAAYQQALMHQLGTQTYVPVSCEYGGSQPSAAAAAATNALPPSDNSVPPRTTTASPTVTEISASSTNTLTSNSSTTLSSNSHNALVPVNSSKEGGASSTSQPLSLSPYSHAVASPTMNNVLYAGYSLNNRTAVRPHLRAPAMYAAHPNLQSSQNVTGISPYVFTQPPPHQGLGVSYMNNLATNASVASMMPYGTQTPSFVSAAGGMAAAAAAAAATGMHGVATYPGLPAGVAAGTTAVPQPPPHAQFMYPSLSYPVSNTLVMPQHTSAIAGAASQYSPWAAAAAAQAAAAAAAGTTEQPYKKLKTV